MEYVSFLSSPQKLIGYHSRVPCAIAKQMTCYHPANMSTSSENLVKIGSVHFQIIGWISEMLIFLDSPLRENML